MLSFRESRPLTTYFQVSSVMAEPVDQQAMFVDGPTRGNKYNSRYLVDESFYMYKRKFKSGDTQFGRHLHLCVVKDCKASASTFSKEGQDTR